jgi:beta-galactosidase
LVPEILSVRAGHARLPLAVCITSLVVGLASPAAAQRQRFSMDPGWRFMAGDPAGAERPGFDDSQWRRVDLPHDWSIEGTPREDAPGGGRVGFFPSGIGWYRKAFRLPAGWRGRIAQLELDGVYMNSDAWVNGTHVGKRPFGYASFAYDITRHLQNGVNVVAVRVDNSRQPNSRWYTGSGIYRHVWLTLADPLRVGHWGTFVTTPRADSSGAQVAARTRVENGSQTIRRGILRSVIVDPEGREVARADTAFSIAGGRSAELEQTLSLSSPALWTIETPNLYTLRSEVLEGSRSTDIYTTPFGVRSIAFDADHGFLLNDRRVKMLGVNLTTPAASAPCRSGWERRLSCSRRWG